MMLSLFLPSPSHPVLAMHARLFHCRNLQADINGQETMDAFLAMLMHTMIRPAPVDFLCVQEGNRSGATRHVDGVRQVDRASHTAVP